LRTHVPEAKRKQNLHDLNLAREEGVDFEATLAKDASVEVSLRGEEICIELLELLLWKGLMLLMRLRMMLDLLLWRWMGLTLLLLLLLLTTKPILPRC
jgi:hypothetical protein